MNKDELKKLCEDIQNETRKGANTAARVGSVMRGIAEQLPEAASAERAGLMSAEDKAKLDTYVGQSIGKVNINHRLADTFFFYHNGSMVMPSADGAYQFTTPYAAVNAPGLVKIGTNYKYGTAEAAMVGFTNGSNALCVAVATQNRYGVVRLNTLESTNIKPFDVLSLASAKAVIEDLRQRTAKPVARSVADFEQRVKMECRNGRLYILLPKSMSPSSLAIHLYRKKRLGFLMPVAYPEMKHVQNLETKEMCPLSLRLVKSNYEFLHTDTHTCYEMEMLCPGMFEGWQPFASLPSYFTKCKNFRKCYFILSQGDKLVSEKLWFRALREIRQDGSEHYIWRLL